MVTDARAHSAPLTDATAVAVANMIDDAQSSRRRPSHSDLDTLIEGARLAGCDPRPRGSGATVGKKRRVTAVLNWALANAPPDGERLVAALIANVRGNGGFTPSSENFVGSEAVSNAVSMFRLEGFDLSADGDLRPLVLEGLAAQEMTVSLRAYALRAQRGVTDAALLAGTGKDLVEATARHVLVQHFGSYPSTANFPTVVGQAFVALGLVTDPELATTAQEHIDASLYLLACGANRLRNQDGTGHGRPFPASVTNAAAQVAVQGMGVVVARMLHAQDALLPGGARTAATSAGRRSH
jgi:hypothetical protein